MPLPLRLLLLGSMTPSVTPSRLRLDTIGTAERAAMISSILRGLLVLWDFLMASEPVVSRVNRASEGFSATIPLQGIVSCV